ncbi:MAG: trypsin-like peptidase domain-containing protein [[Clostridium] leptum]
MTDREWPEYPNQSGGETVTGPESAQEEAASERGWEADPPSPASEECQSEEGSNWERTAQEAEEEVPGGQRGEDLGTLGQAQELQEAAPFFQEEGSEPSQTTETSGWKPGMESSEDSREEPDLPAESPESSGQELQEAAALSPEETQVPFQTENAWEPGAERPENPDGGESQEPVAERPSAQPYDQSPAFSRPAPQAPPPVWNPGWQASYRQAPQNYPYGQGQYQGGWHPQQRQVPPPYYGGTPYQAPNPYQNQAPYGYPGQAARNQGQPGYQESRWYPQQPAQPARTGSVPPPSQPPQKEAGELPDAKPPEKKRMNKKTKVFLWVIGAVLVLLGAAMVLYSVGLTSGWFGGETAEPPQASSSTPAPENDQKLLEIEEIPQDGMMTPNQVYEKVKHSVVAVVTYGQGSDLTDSPISSGSGIVFSEDGYIVTNSHVIGDSNQYPVKVVFTGQDENEEDQEYPAQIVGYDKRTDIAVLKIDAAGLTPAEFADSDQLKVGDTVLSLGNPGVAGENFTNTLTKGMVSAVNRTVTMSSINMQYIQTDAAINPGSSGGALLNLYGQVVGINAAKITTTEIEGICFAIPTNIAKDVINDIVKNGYVSDRVRLGVTIRGLSSYEAEMYNVPQGLVIVGFSSDSEIPSKGAEIGDIITAINGVNTTSSNTLYNELEKFKAGEKVKLTIYRQASGSQRARTFEIEVTLLEDRGETQSAVTPTPEAP